LLPVGLSFGREVLDDHRQFVDILALPLDNLTLFLVAHSQLIETVFLLDHIGTENRLLLQNEIHLVLSVVAAHLLSFPA
ncbi:MAG: hypothetical protein ACREDR_07545, partial [Blastocatellia bacterium]